MIKNVFVIMCISVMIFLSAGCSILNKDSGADAGIPDSQNTATETKPTNDSPYEKGVITSDSFESKYMDLRFSLPENYIMATEEDIYGMMDVGADALGIDGKIVDYAKLTTVYEMMVTAPIGLPSVIVMTEKLALKNMSVEQYFDALQKQLSNLDTVNYQFEDIVSIEIAGQSYQKIVTKVEMNGIDMIQGYIFRKSADRIVGFITTYSSDTEEALDTLLKSFTKY